MSTILRETTARLNRVPTRITPLQFPEVSKELLEHLEKTFPDSLNMAHTHGLERAYGMRVVISHIKGLYEAQQEQDDTP